MHIHRLFVVDSKRRKIARNCIDRLNLIFVFMQFDVIQPVDYRQNMQIQFYAIFGRIDKYFFSRRRLFGFFIFSYDYLQGKWIQIFK